MVTHGRQTILIHCVCSLIVVALFSCPRPSTQAQQATTDVDVLIPLEGLDPVMLTQGKEIQGDMKYKVRRGRFEYIFANAENKAAFEKEPSRYEIQLDGHCARMGAPTTGNPDLYVIHDGRIYIFGSEECQKLFKATPENYLEIPATLKSPTAEMVKRGQELIAKAVEAVGGSKLDHLVSFQTRDLRANGVKNVLTLAFPDAVRQETIRPNFTLISVITPAESFFIVNDAARPMAEANRNAVFNQLNHEVIVLLRARTRPDFKAWAAGNDTAEEVTVERVEVQLSRFTTTLRIDPATGRVLAQTFRGRGPGGVVGEIAIHYSDFRSVDGLSLPFKMSATFGGQPYPALSATIEAATINGQINSASFKKPVPRQ